MSGRLFLNHARRHAPLCWAVAGGCSAVVVGREVQKRDGNFVTTRCDAAFAEEPSMQSSLEKDLSTSGSSSSPSSTPKDDYPNFTRHGSKAILPKILTPELYHQLKGLKTPTFGVTLEDMISAGVMLPWGANPPRGVGGVYAGDADCYKTFAPLILPLVEEAHGVQLMEGGAGSDYHRGSFVRRLPLAKKKVSRLRRQVTNLSPEQVLDTEIDPSGSYVLYTRMRLARNLKGFAFCSMISRSERRRIEKLFQDIVESDFRPLHGGAYVPLHAMTNQQHDAYISRRMCFLDPDEYKLAAKLGRDWPDGRGIYCSHRWDASNRYENPAPPAEPAEVEDWEESPPNVIMWLNYDDHIWIISRTNSGNVQKVFTCLSDAVRKLELGLLERNHSFEIDPKLGFLTSSPSNVGTALRASMSVKLVRLGKDPALFHEILHLLHLEAKSDYAETDQRYTGIFDIANAERLGRTEVQLINLMILGIQRLIELEKKLERGETVTLKDVDDVVKNSHHYR